MRGVLRDTAVELVLWAAAALLFLGVPGLVGYVVGSGLGLLVGLVVGLLLGGVVFVVLLVTGGVAAANR